MTRWLDLIFNRLIPDLTSVMLRVAGLVYV